ISDEVIAKIAGTAAMEVEGVGMSAGAAAKAAHGVKEFLGVKNQAKTVRVVTENGETSIDIEIEVGIGCKVHDVASQVQKKIKTAVETMTNLNVRGVNVYVVGIAQERHKEHKEHKEEI
ncbi:MAG: Asp23/Gls24 family envelope stress response protein, partial [Firmicutes bacterium]|nr:Asp23/Gls24 family envelope stress response protein [Bacillota bacterium]